VHGATMCATKPPPSRCVIGINFPGVWTRVRLPDDGLLAAPEGRLYWHLHRRCTMHALRGVRRAVVNEPRAACSTRAEPQSKPIDELCRKLIRPYAVIKQPGAVSAGLLSIINSDDTGHRLVQLLMDTTKTELHLTTARSTTDQAEVCGLLAREVLLHKVQMQQVLA